MYFVEGVGVYMGSGWDWSGVDSCEWNFGGWLVNGEINGRGLFVCYIVLWFVFLVCEWLI